MPFDSRMSITPFHFRKLGLLTTLSVRSSFILSYFPPTFRPGQTKFQDCGLTTREIADSMPRHDNNDIDDFQGGYRRSGKGGRRSDGGRGGRGGRGGGDRDMVVSKAISWILRHGAQKEGLRLDSMGYADVGELVSEIFVS